MSRVLANELVRPTSQSASDQITAAVEVMGVEPTLAAYCIGSTLIPPIHIEGLMIVPRNVYFFMKFAQIKKNIYFLCFEPFSKK